jgi:hypothetical protein
VAPSGRRIAIHRKTGWNRPNLNALALLLSRIRVLGLLNRRKKLRKLETFIFESLRLKTFCGKHAGSWSVVRTTRHTGRGLHFEYDGNDASWPICETGGLSDHGSFTEHVSLLGSWCRCPLRRGAPNIQPSIGLIARKWVLVTDIRERFSNYFRLAKTPAHLPCENSGWRASRILKRFLWAGKQGKPNHEPRQ